MFKIYFEESLKIFLITYCHLKKAGYYRMHVKNILFTFGMNQLMAATRRPLRSANQLRMMSLFFFNILVLMMFFVGQYIWREYLFHMINK